MVLSADPTVPFPAFFVRYRTKTEQRMFVAFHALNWIRFQHKRGSTGAIMIDIDDTLIDGNESVSNGFQYMKELYHNIGILFPLHIVTARPREDHHAVMKMLLDRGFCLPPDRLHMLPTELYGQDYSHVERFKWNTFVQIGKSHGGVVARFGDKMWDVAHFQSLHGTLAHVHDRDCYIFRDPSMKGTISYKLPGIK
jgi:hypothetical protein